MNNEINFALLAIKKNIQNNMELRANFIGQIIGMILNNSTFIFIWVFFVKTVGVVNGWEASDIIALQGFTSLGFGVVFSIFGGIVSMNESVDSGQFDQFMLSPKNLLLRVMTSSFSSSAIGDILFGLICFLVYIFITQITFFKIILYLFFMLTVCITFMSVTLFVFSLAFYFSNSARFIMSLFELFLTPAMFHSGAIQGKMRFVFTFIVPSLLIGGIPTELIRNFNYPSFFIVVLISFFWALFSIKFFYFSVSKYESSNFFTFGK